MSRMLAIVAVAGLALCAVFLGGAWALGGDDVFHDPRSLEGLKPLIDLATHKEWHWAGGDTLALDAPVTIRYQPQGKPNVTITGTAEAMDHVHVSEGRITSDAAPRPREKAKLQAVVSGVPIRKFVVNDGQSLELGHIEQEELTVYINGQSKVSGDGKVQKLTLVLNGPGTANLGALQVEDATVTALGPGNVTLSPHGELKLFVAGPARIRLLTRPTSIKRRILGNAIIETPDGTESMPPPTPATPATPPTPATPAGAGQVEMQMQMQMQIPVAEPRQRVFLRGSDNVNLGHIDQDHLTIAVTGAGTITAEGRVDDLKVQIMGPGSANLGGLTARQVKVDIAGSGNAVVAPAQEVKVDIAGSGNVRLTTKPRQIRRTILGSGHLIELP